MVDAGGNLVSAMRRMSKITLTAGPVGNGERRHSKKPSATIMTTPKASQPRRSPDGASFRKDRSSDAGSFRRGDDGSFRRDKDREASFRQNRESSFRKAERSASAKKPKPKADAQPLRPAAELVEAAAALRERAGAVKRTAKEQSAAMSLDHRLGVALVEAHRGQKLAGKGLLAEWDRNQSGNITRIEFRQAIRNKLHLHAHNNECDKLFDTSAPHARPSGRATARPRELAGARAGRPRAARARAAALCLARRRPPLCSRLVC
jgi:hypothetical protein